MNRLLFIAARLHIRFMLDTGCQAIYSDKESKLIADNEPRKGSTPAKAIPS